MIVKKLISAVAMTTVAFAAHAQTTTSEKEYELPKCSKPVASVMVGQVSCKSAACQNQAANQDPRTSGLAALVQLASGNPTATFPGIGDGMTAMLTTVLRETGCFVLQEREAIEELNRELALVGKKVEVEQADFMISGAITSLSMNTEKKQFAGGMIPILGAISSTTKTADLGMDIKIIDVNRAKILDAKTFTANNETSSFSFGGAAFGGGMGAIGGMSSLKGTPLEGIVRDVLVRVASFASRSLVTTTGVTDVTFTNPIISADK